MRHGLALASLKATTTRRIIGVPRTILALSHVAVTAPADTNENVLATVTIPANAMGVNGLIEVHAIFMVTNNANTKTCRVRFGGIAGQPYVALGMTTNASYFAHAIVANRGVANSQIGHTALSSAYGQTTSANITSSVDTTASVDVVISGQKASAGDTMTLEGYIVELVTA